MRISLNIPTLGNSDKPTPLKEAIELSLLVTTWNDPSPTAKDMPSSVLTFTVPLKSKPFAVDVILSDSIIKLLPAFPMGAGVVTVCFGGALISFWQELSAISPETKKPNQAACGEKRDDAITIVFTRRFENANNLNNGKQETIK